MDTQNDIIIVWRIGAILSYIIDSFNDLKFYANLAATENDSRPEIIVCIDAG